MIPEEQYRRQLATHASVLAGLEKKRKTFGWLRLGVFLAAFFSAYLIFTAYGLWGFVPVVTGLVVLLFLVSRDVANNADIRNTKTLLRINEEEMEAIHHHFHDRDTGNRFLPADHAYAVDLDIFGTASVFQWLSRCYTEQGQALLAENLLLPLSTGRVLERQGAVRELAPLLAWRQQAQAFSMQATVTQKTERRILAWTENEETHFGNNAWKTAVLGYSTLTLASLVAAILGYIPAAAFSSLYFFYLVVSLLLSRKAIKPYIHLDGIVKETNTLQKILSWFESRSFSAAHLQQLQAGIKAGDKKAGDEIKQLKVILDRFDLRTSIVGMLFFNPFLLWDVRQMIALNAWRKRNGAHLPAWFTAVAEVEVLHSLSTVHFNYPAWCFPTFVNEHLTFLGKQVGHPLLPENQRVNNSFTLHGTAKIALITGSNMAGKSTFLRSLGVNTVLAQMGSPACAVSLRLSPVQLVSSMRIADNLAENTSTFYAELKKLRTIIEQVEAHRPVFILLDEILRGTNSFDRHKGSAALIRQLIRKDAVAVIATHDVELAQLEKEYPASITNYHFDVEVEGEELYFDYRLKPGVCKSLNASLLMKKIGIEMQE